MTIPTIGASQRKPHDKPLPERAKIYFKWDPCHQDCHVCKPDEHTTLTVAWWDGKGWLPYYNQKFECMKFFNSLLEAKMQVQGQYISQLTRKMSQEKVVYRPFKKP